MKSLITLLFIMAGFLIMSGIHEERLAKVKKQTQVVYKYIPRSALDEQYNGTPVSTRFQKMFDASKTSTWMEQSVSPKIPTFNQNASELEDDIQETNEHENTDSETDEED